MYWNAKRLFLQGTINLLGGGKPIRENIKKKINLGKILITMGKQTKLLQFTHNQQKEGVKLLILIVGKHRQPQL